MTDPNFAGIGVCRAAWRCAISDGVPRRSLIVAVIVGAVLNLINQGDALIGGGPIDWVKALLTFAVPYCVSTYGAVSYHLKVSRHHPREGDPRGELP